jgi:hypothetical protein
VNALAAMDVPAFDVRTLEDKIAEVKALVAENRIAELEARVAQLEAIARHGRGGGGSAHVITDNRLARMRQVGGAFTAERVAQIFAIDNGAASQWLRSCWCRGQLKRAMRGLYVFPGVIL